MIEFKKPQEEKYLEDMTRQELLDYLAELEVQLQELDAREPKRMGTEAYEAWADEHEELEDYLDEILDRMEELCK